MIDMIEPKHKIKYEIQNIEKSVKCIKKDKIDKAIQKYKNKDNYRLLIDDKFLH